ncbi:alanine/glycine:cation symporter family protein [Henriciella aquimarina]|uniref:alanine/glycine:cation symporter family protein n=1 Tax=Henriciella aquimarina TaxID=545261 RepID=UPI0009FCE74D|nr:amino acid carrier protein [Henriciella aquimarina]
MSPISNGFAALADWLASTTFYAVNVGGVEINLIVVWLATAMIFFTVRLGFLNVRAFPLAIRNLVQRRKEEGAAGELSHFEALMTALSGTVGLGNIAGVSIAIAMGGPGAVVWMVLLGFFAMTLKCVEVTLGVKYRQIRENGQVSGGPMWTLRNGLAAHGRPRLGKILGGIYAGFCMFAFIQVIQVNQSYSQLSVVMGWEQSQTTALVFGLVIAGLAALVLIGGVTVLASVTSRLVPLMCLIYVMGVVVVLATHATLIPGALWIILKDAVAPEAVAGGIFGAFVAGMRRAVFSNEAGVGTASIVHALVKTDEPASEGIVALLEPFIDTIVICTCTALVVVVTGAYQGEHSDIAMTSAAFESVVSWFPSVLAVVVCLFAFSTIITVGYYGLQAWGYLVGFSPLKARLYLAFFCGALPIGSLVDVSTVIKFSDSFFFLLSVPNVIGLYIMSADIRSECLGYVKRQRARLSSRS